MKAAAELCRDLVLVGGGHSHGFGIAYVGDDAD